MKNGILKKSFSVVAIALLCFSCSDDETTNNPNLQKINKDEVKTVVETVDLVRVADNILTDIFTGDSEAKESAKKPDDCYEGTFSENSFTLTFDNCTLENEEAINGTISVDYVLEGEKVSYMATFIDFSVNGVVINGTRSFNFDGDIDINEGSYSFSVTSNLAIVFEDSTIVEINGTKSFGFTIGDSPETSLYTIDGGWSLKTNGDTYSVNINDTLEGNLACVNITTGSMELAKNGLVVNVDFGDGTCDDVATLTYPDDTSEEISLND